MFNRKCLPCAHHLKIYFRPQIFTLAHCAYVLFTLNAIPYRTLVDEGHIEKSNDLEVRTCGTCLDPAAINSVFHLEFTNSHTKKQIPSITIFQEAKTPSVSE